MSPIRSWASSFHPFTCPYCGQWKYMWEHLRVCEQKKKAWK